MSAEPKRRKTHLGPTEMLRLDAWAAPLTWLFPFGFGPYLVGSVMTRRTYRDVDVRQPVPDDHPLFANEDLRRLLNVAMSVWGQQTTGLLIDFQFQPMTEFHEQDGKYRNPLGGRWRTVHRAVTEGQEDQH